MESKGQPILADLVKNVLKDLAKVVIDNRERRAPIGNFELIYKAKNEVNRPKGTMSLDLTIEGKKHGIKIRK